MRNNLMHKMRDDNVGKKCLKQMRLWHFHSGSIFGICKCTSELSSSLVPEGMKWQTKYSVVFLSPRCHT